jgi:hypothetical protein
VENGRHGQPGGSFLESESEKEFCERKKKTLRVSRRGGSGSAQGIIQMSRYKIARHRMTQKDFPDFGAKFSKIKAGTIVKYVEIVNTTRIHYNK